MVTSAPNRHKFEGSVPYYYKVSAQLILFLQLFNLFSDTAIPPGREINGVTVIANIRNNCSLTWVLLGSKLVLLKSTLG